MWPRSGSTSRRSRSGRPFPSAARIVIFPPGRPDPRDIGALIAERGITVAMLSPGMLTELVRVALPDLGGMRMIATGGDVLPPATAADLLAAHPGVTLLNVYGPTETTIVASSHEVGDRDGGPIPIGRPLRGYDLHVLDDDGEPVTAGEPGELWIGGPGVGRGYRNDPERTAERFRHDSRRSEVLPTGRGTACASARTASCSSSAASTTR